ASCLNIIERKWRNERKKKKQKRIKDATNIDIPNWLKNLPENIQPSVESIVNLLDNTPELSEDKQQTVTELLHDLIPEYANLHWRYLHPEIKNAAEADYKNQDY